MQTLSLCMITKDSSKTLARALHSVLDLNPEIIVVDTGSTDDTVAMAKSFGAHIECIPWENDFSKARNTALNAATKDWILVLDSDEYLSPEAICQLKNILTKPKYKAYSFVIKNIGENTPPAYPLVRLWVNHPEIRFAHRVHELIDWTFLKLYTSSDIGYLSEAIFHDGYACSTAFDTKQKRNHALLKSYTDAEKDSYYYYLVGREAFFSHDYKLCLDSFNQALIHPELVQGQVTYMFLLRMYCLYFLGNYPLAMAYIQHALTLTPHFRELYLILYDCYRTLGDLELAQTALDSFNTLPIDDIHYPRIFS